MSMPPMARWEYAFEPEPGSAEARLQAFLQPRDWLGEFAGDVSQPIAESHHD